MLRSFQFQRRIKLIHRQYFSPQGIKFWFKFYSASGVTDPEAKREHEVKTIGTHDGTFRCREALACYMLKVLPEYKDARILRTRDPALLKGCDVVVDIGDEYNPIAHRYDVPRKFDCSMNSLTGGKKEWTTQLSSAGLIYFHFGHRVISTITGLDLTEDEAALEIIYDTIYTDFVEEIDASSNGMFAIYDNCDSSFSRSTTTLVQRVLRLNPLWNASDDKINLDSQFQLAMQLVGKEFSKTVMGCKDIWLPARAVVQRAFENRFQVDESGEIITLETRCPWKRHLKDLLESMSLPNLCVKFVIFEHVDEMWLAQVVPIDIPGEPDKKVCSVLFPKEWRGRRNEELSQISGIPGCIYVHDFGYIGGNHTYEGALAMAKKTLSTVVYRIR